MAAVAPAIQNRRVRELLRPILLSGSVEHKQKASSWIVKNWGGIKRHNKERFDALVKSFNDFSVPTIEICIGALGFDRVSSWSKLISFAHPDEFPVYDAKAVSKLNSLLIGPNTTRFYVPPTQVRILQSIQNEAISFGYHEYRELLRSAAKSFNVSILDVETALFARSNYL